MQGGQAKYIHVALKQEIRDVAGECIARDAARFLGIDTGRVLTSKLYAVAAALTPEQVERFAFSGLCDPILHNVHPGDHPPQRGCRSYVLVGKQPGVTDDEGVSAQTTLADLLDIQLGHDGQAIFTSDVYLLEQALPDDQLRQLAEELLGNPLVHYFSYGSLPARIAYLPEVDLQADRTVEYIDLERSDEDLARLSRDLVLNLSLPELHAIRDHYRSPDVAARLEERGRPTRPTDCELEVFAQTWSEHCKHKEFSALIAYHDEERGTRQEVDSLFGTYIRGATEVVSARLAEAGQHWLLKVFSDNAGVVRVDDERVFVWKVETHNTPSALDPYGGAITGILGNNRDPLGTGRGGGRLLFNTNVLCFGPPDFDKPLLTGQLHPRRIMEGVRRGIEDGGNKSGIPTVNGAIVFDDRYAGKPLVFCGTGSLMPAAYQGLPTWEKEATTGDCIVMAGGRVGKDGIHGATFSSVEIDKHSPRTAVQIGSPITQKLLADFLEQACASGLVKCSTDNGAGGLSSSVGELAPLAGGAEVHLEQVPLKYSGLRPWEIFISESQERMTLVVEPNKLDALLSMGREYEVELSHIGCFTASGLLEVFYQDTLAASLELDFLHHGVPRKHMKAFWRPPALSEPELPADLDPGEALLSLLGSLDICSREWVIRQYDHEVKGKTIIKPLMGPAGLAPQDAAVMRLGFDGYRGLAVSCGILPRYGDLDAYHMSAGAFDEAVRQIVAVGGRLTDMTSAGGPWWSVCDNFCMPDSMYHPADNPDGEHKLAQLVRMCQALYDMATSYIIPLTSGKDSMKNDLRSDGVKISVPPTVLYSMVAEIADVRHAVTTELKAAGDLLYLLGTSYDELGGSELYRLYGELGANVPQVRIEQALALYRRVMAANAEGLLVSCHDLSDGGLAVAISESTFGTGLGAEIDIDELLAQVSTAATPELAVLFGESHSRFIASVRPEHCQRFEELLGSDAHLLGRVSAEPRLRIHANGQPRIDLACEQLLAAWQRDF